MGKLVLKNITFTLDPKSIQRAVNQIKAVEKGLVKGLQELAKTLIEHGVVVAKMYVAQWGAIDSGTLVDSIDGEYNESDHSGRIWTDCNYAVYVEFGTGIVGESMPHPLSAELGVSYDKNGHGDAGWWYPSEEGWYQPKDGGPLMAWTKGMPSRPFMYDTLRNLERIAEEEGGRIIAEYIP